MSFIMRQCKDRSKCFTIFDIAEKYPYICKDKRVLMPFVEAYGYCLGAQGESASGNYSRQAFTLLIISPFQLQMGRAVRIFEELEICAQNILIASE